MYLAIDTETTDLPRSHLEPSHPFQPHLLQFGAIAFDEQGDEIDRLFALVRPGPAALLSTSAFGAHGISLERANREGLDPFEVFSWFTAQASCARLIVGHNVQFDIQIMRILGARLTGKTWVPPCPLFCTMANSAPELNLPPTARMLAQAVPIPNHRPCLNASVISSGKNCQMHMTLAPTSVHASGYFVIWLVSEVSDRPAIGESRGILPRL